jgi:hypothetical protein
MREAREGEHTQKDEGEREGRRTRERTEDRRTGESTRSMEH